MDWGRLGKHAGLRLVDDGLLLEDQAGSSPETDSGEAVEPSIGLR